MSDGKAGREMMSKGAYLDSPATDFIFDMMVPAAARLRPTSTMCASPFVCRLKASAIPCPMPDVPPTKTATGVVRLAADAMFSDAAKDAMVLRSQEVLMVTGAV